MCTPWALEWVVLATDWAGLRRFAGEWRKFKGWNPVRVPPRAGTISLTVYPAVSFSSFQLPGIGR